MIRVSVNAMSRDRDRIETLIGQLRDSKNELEAALGTMAGCWEGPGWTAFQNQVREDMAYMDDLCAELERYVVSMQDAAKLYNKSEQNTYSKVRSIWV